jgi:thiamine biosynthesis protein ThiI
VGLKGRNRSSFERQLQQNIEESLRAVPGAEVSRISGRLSVAVKAWEDTATVAKIVSRIPGVVRVSNGIKTKQDIEEACEAALWLLDDYEPYTSFKVEARRANTNYPLDSMQLNQLIGAWLSENTKDKQVQMRSPDARVHVEMIEGSCFVYVRTVKGVGGLPVGSAGRVVCLLSAGLDSPVAAWRMMKRGATVTALHFSGRPETADTSEHLVQDILTILKPCGGIERLCVVPFGTYQREIASIVPSKLRVIFYRRLMFAVANRVAQHWKAKALVTGESLGQVASQTLDNILAVDSVALYPVFRPLIGTDKQEIIAEAQMLGTYETSSQNHEDCCTLFMPRNPETHAKVREVEEVALQLPIEDWVTSIMDSLEVHELGSKKTV